MKKYFIKMNKLFEENEEKIRDNNGDIVREYPNKYYWIRSNYRYNSELLGKDDGASDTFILRKYPSVNDLIAITAYEDDRGYELVYRIKGDIYKKFNSPNLKYYKYIIDLLCGNAHWSDSEMNSITFSGYSFLYDANDDLDFDKLPEFYKKKLKESGFNISQGQPTKHQIEEYFESFLDMETDDKEYMHSILYYLPSGMTWPDIFDKFTLKDGKKNLIKSIYSNYAKDWENLDNINQYLVNYLSTYVSAKDIINQYKLSIEITPKKSNSNLWTEIVDMLDMNKIKKILKDEDLTDDFLTDVVQQHKNFDMDYLDGDEVYEILKDYLCDPDEKLDVDKIKEYLDAQNIEFDDIFDMSDIKYEISRTLSLEEKEDLCDEREMFSRY